MKEPDQVISSRPFKASMPVMPKGRYRLMTEYMDRVGTHGKQMMYRTCTVQVNLDFAALE